MSIAEERDYWQEQCIWAFKRLSEMQCAEADRLQAKANLILKDSKQVLNQYTEKRSPSIKKKKKKPFINSEGSLVFE